MRVWRGLSGGCIREGTGKGRGVVMMVVVGVVGGDGNGNGRWVEVGFEGGLGCDRGFRGLVRVVDMVLFIVDLIT